MSLTIAAPSKRSVPINRRSLVDEIAAFDSLAVLSRQWAASNTVVIEDLGISSRLVVDWVCDVNPLHCWSQDVATRVRVLKKGARSCPKCSISPVSDERVALLRSQFD